MNAADTGPAAGGRVLLVGAGAIGGIVAAALPEAGIDVAVVTGNEEITRAIRERGLVVERDGRRSVGRPRRVFTRIGEVPAGERFDAAWLFTKANTVVGAAEAAAARLATGGCVVTFQNGYVEERVAGTVGAGRVVGAVIGFTATMRAPGVCERTSEGAWFIGEMDGRITGRLRWLERALAPVARVVVSANIAGVLWAKLCLNCTVTALGGLGGRPLAATLADARHREVFFAVMREVVAAADAEGTRLEKLAIEPEMLRAPPTGALEELLIRHYGRGKPSVLQSLERGRPTEIDFICGHVARVARRRGGAAPVNEAVVAMIHEIERGERSIAAANLDELRERCALS